MSTPTLQQAINNTHDTARLAFILKLVDTLQSMPDAYAIEDVACRMLAENLPVNFAWFAKIGPDRRHITIRSEYSRDRSIRLAGNYPAVQLQSLVRFIESEQPYIIDDAFQSFNIESPERAFYEDKGIRSCMAFPVAKGKQALTYIAIADDIPHRWTAREVSLVHETAFRVGDAIERTGQAGQNLNKPVDEYHAILNSIDVAFAFCVLIRDKEGKACDFRYLESNATFAKQRAMKMDDFVGRKGSEVHPDREPWWLQTYEKAVDLHLPIRAERFVDGRWYDVGVHPFGNGCFSVVFRDITQRRLDEETLRIFIANASHELKTPLTSIASYGQLLQKQFEEVQDERASLMQKLNTQVCRLHKLIGDLLDTTTCSSSC